jgi:FkbM family methyltransferase
MWFSKSPQPPIVQSQTNRAQSGKTSYAQCGEDLIVRFALDVLRIAQPAYLDIGAYDPVKLSNTYHFYDQGASGVCVEADPDLAPLIAAHRTRDRVLNVAVSGKDKGRREFYLMSESSLNTLSLSEAERLVREEGCTLRSTLEIEVVPISELIAQAFPSRMLDFVSIDVEGGDEELITNFDFEFVRPKVFCIETLSYSRLGGQTKSVIAAEILNAKGYMSYADTYINTIFVDETAWNSRH